MFFFFSLTFFASYCSKCTVFLKINRGCNQNSSAGKHDQKLNWNVQLLAMLLGRCSRCERSHLDRYYDIWREWSLFSVVVKKVYVICLIFWLRYKTANDSFLFFLQSTEVVPHTDHHQFNNIQHRSPMTHQGFMHHATEVFWGKRLVQNTPNSPERSAKIMKLWQKNMAFSRSVTPSSRFDRKRLAALVTVKTADDFKSLWHVFWR